MSENDEQLPPMLRGPGERIIKMTEYLDKNLMDLASYQDSQGLMRTPNPESSMVIFRELKRKIQDGTSTFDKIAFEICSQFGAFPAAVRGQMAKQFDEMVPPGNPSAKLGNTIGFG